jgi:hypothetical protein
MSTTARTRTRPPPRRAPRWSKRIDALVAYVATGCGPGLQSDLGHWLQESPRFADFVDARRDKIRKKLLNADGAEGRRDVRAELRLAHRLLLDRRFEVEFEAYGARQRGPDLSVTYRANQRFNLEVTRLRGAADVSRLSGVIAAKVRQLPGEVPNALVIFGQDLDLGLAEAQLSEAARQLKAHVDARDDAFFARHGAGDARSFYARYLRLSGVFFVVEEGEAAVFWANREARWRLTDEIVTRVRA